MSQEEFDRKLKQTFEDEYYPPAEHLWNNIDKRINQPKKKYFWWWIAPAALIAVSALMYYFIPKSEQTNSITAVQPTTSYNNNTTKTANQNNSPATINNNAEQVEMSGNTNNNESLVHSTANYQRNTNSTNTNQSENNTANTERNHNSNNVGITVITQENVSNNSNLEQSFTFSNLDIVRYPYVNLLDVFLAPKARYNDFVANIPLGVSLNNKPKNNKNKLNSRYLNFGFGSTIAFNKVEVDNSLQPMVHFHLWDKKDKLTRNGRGFNSYITYTHKFSKYFGVESGIGYTLRTENIQMNEVSDSIAFRSGNKIVGYQRIMLLAISKNNQGGYDTTPYNAVQAFTILADNKYNLLQIPIKAFGEIPLSKKLTLTLDAGIAFSYLYTKKMLHLNIVDEKIYEEKNKSLFSLALSSKLALYTKFNDFGEIGLYTGIAKYQKTLGVANNQYQLKMNDLYFGIGFRRAF